MRPLRSFVPAFLRRTLFPFPAHLRRMEWLASGWGFLFAFILVALLLGGWTFFQLQAWQASTRAQWKEDVNRAAVNRATLLSNWLSEREEDVQDLSLRIWIAQILSIPGTRPPSNVSAAEIQSRMQRFAQTYGYLGVAVLDRNGRLAASSAQWNLSPERFSLQRDQTRVKCGAVLDVIQGERGRPILVAVAPVLPFGIRTCSEENLRGYVAVETNIDQVGLPHLRLIPPPNGITAFFFVQNKNGRLPFTFFSQSDRGALAGSPTTAAEDAEVANLAVRAGEGYYAGTQGDRQFWFAVQPVWLDGWSSLAYVRQDRALAEYFRNRRILLLFDALILLLVAGGLVAVSLRLRARRLEAELERHREIAGLREYARRIVESSPVGLVVLDAGWRIVSTNQSFRQMAGIGEGTEAFDQVETWIEADQVGPLMRWLPSQIREGLATLRSRSGRPRPVHLTLTELAETGNEGGRYLLTVEDLSHRKWIEERYRLLFEQNMAGIVQTNADGVIIDCNDAYARMMGFRSRLELLSRPTMPFYRNKADREHLLAELHRTGRVDGYELEMNRPDGSSVWVILSASLLTNGGESQPIVQKTLVDITQKKQTQQIIEKQARLLDLTRDAVIVRDMTGMIRFWNHGARLMYGWKAEEANGRFIHTLLKSQFPKPLPAIQEELLQKGYWQGEILHIREDGEPVEVSSRWVLQKDAQGCPESILETNTDITLRKAAETALAASNRRIIEIFDSIGEGFFALDDKWRFTYVNREAERMMRLPQSELLGRSVWDVFPAFRTGRFYQFCQRALEEEHKVEFEEFSPALGMWLEIHVYPAPSGLSVYFRDVSERRNLELRLRQSEKMDAVGRLAGGIAHDFNNILNVIGGYAELLAQHLDSDTKLQRYAHEIVDAAMRAGALTRQLLAFGRRQRLSPRVVNLNAVLNGLHPLVQRLIGEDIELATAEEPQLGNVQADPSQIEQVILNLAANARDAMPRGGKLLIESSNLDLDECYQDDQIRLDPGRYVLLTVTDTGAGMESSVRQRIFEPFFTTKDVGKGTGLGLSTVDGVVQQSGGAIWVYSKPGEGTTFKIYLPRVDERAGTEAAAEGLDEHVRGGNESILLVEDEESLRAFLREVLEDYGYRVVTAASGDEATRLFTEAGPFQMIVTDVVMPGMGGAELVEQVSRKEPEIRVLYISGYTGRAMLRQGRLRPGARFLAKPFTAKHLARFVRECLDHPISDRLLA